MIPQNLIKRKSGEFDLKVIIRLDLSHSKLSSMKGLSKCFSLISLDLSHNQIKDLEELKKFTTLEHLDLSFNHLSSICIHPDISGENNVETKSTTYSLAVIALEGNQISNIDDLKGLSIFKQLRELSFQTPLLRTKGGYANSNPLCGDRLYQSTTLQVIPYLFMLDKECVKLRQAAGLGPPGDNHSSSHESKWFGNEYNQKLDFAFQRINKTIHADIDWVPMNDIRELQQHAHHGLKELNGLLKDIEVHTEDDAH